MHWYSLLQHPCVTPLPVPVPVPSCLPVVLSVLLAVVQENLIAAAVQQQREEEQCHNALFPFVFSPFCWVFPFLLGFFPFLLGFFPFFHRRTAVLRHLEAIPSRLGFCHQQAPVAPIASAK